MNFGATFWGGCAGGTAALGPVVERLLHLNGIPSHDDVGEEAHGIGDRLHLLIQLMVFLDASIDTTVIPVRKYLLSRNTRPPREALLRWRRSRFKSLT